MQMLKSLAKYNQDSYLDTVGVRGSIPRGPTIIDHSQHLNPLLWPKLTTAKFSTVYRRWMKLGASFTASGEKVVKSLSAMGRVHG